VVRKGFTFTDVSGAHARTYRAGEALLLPVAVGDGAHQLHRAPAPAGPARAPRKATRQGSSDGDE
jgi:hypothetical protein